MNKILNDHQGISQKDQDQFIQVWQEKSASSGITEITDSDEILD